MSTTVGNASLAVASILLSLVFGELVVRPFYLPATRVMDDFRLLSYYDRHEVLGWLPRKNFTSIHKQRGSFETTFRTNSRRLRDKEYTLERLPGASRILVLGDSFTWGYGVNDREIYTEVLESLLKNVEVINLGVTAFGTRQELEYLKLEGLKYQPDFVIVGFCLNDITRESTSPRPKYDSVQTLRGGTSRTSQNLLQVFKRWLSESSVLYNLARSTINTHKSLVKFLARLGLKEDLSGFGELDVNLMPALRVYPEKLQMDFEQTKAELLEMQRLLAHRNIRFIIALIPSVQSMDEGAFKQSIAYSIFDDTDFDLGKPYKLLEAFARSHEIEVINPFPEWKKRYKTGRDLYLKRDIHFNKLGHELFAREIFNYLTVVQRRVGGW